MWLNYHNCNLKETNLEAFLMILQPIPHFVVYLISDALCLCVLKSKSALSVLKKQKMITFNEFSEFIKS